MALPRALSALVTCFPAGVGRALFFKGQFEQDRAAAAGSSAEGQDRLDQAGRARRDRLSEQDRGRQDPASVVQGLPRRPDAKARTAVGLAPDTTGRPACWVRFGAVTEWALRALYRCGHRLVSVVGGHHTLISPKGAVTVAADPAWGLSSGSPAHPRVGLHITDGAYGEPATRRRRRL